MKHPAENAWDVIDSVIAKGSSKDGSKEQWRNEPQMYHVVKGLNHLATHIRNVYDPRKVDDENHLHLALTRIAMALCIADTQNQQSPKG